MTEPKSFSRDEVIFRQGEDGRNMFRIRDGKVGIFLDYGGESETKLSELIPGQFFGEMGLLDDTPRSATAVSLDENTVLEIITEEDFSSVLKDNPDQILLLMQQMSSRLRRTTRDYAGVCCTTREAVETEQAGLEKSPELQERIEKYISRCDAPGSGRQA